jgi:putative membrane protein
MTAALVVFGLLYALGLARVRRPHPRAAAAWLAGLVVLGIATRVDDRTLTLHMVQHGLIGMVAAPLLVAGAPFRLALGALPRRHARPLARALHRARVLTHPLVAASAFSITLLVVHLPAVYDAAERASAVHALVHAALLWSAIWLWLPLIAADPIPHASPTATVAALIGSMTVMTALGVAIAAPDHIIYAAYPDLTDQHHAGGLMAIGGMAAMVPLFVALTWRALAAEERRQRAREARP